MTIVSVVVGSGSVDLALLNDMNRRVLVVVAVDEGVREGLRRKAYEAGMTAPRSSMFLDIGIVR